MATTKLVPYWIELREIQEPGTSWNQTSIRSHDPTFPYDNLADYFYDFVSKYTGDENVHVDEANEKTFSVQEPIERNGNTIEGQFKSGEYGHNADFWDVKEHERIQDARKENHAEEVPYYFLFHIPDYDPTQALLILSKYKRKGIKTVFRDLFLPRFRNIDRGEAYMEMRPHYSDRVLEELNEADSIASIRFRGKSRIPAREEYADRNDIQRFGKEISGQIDIGTELKITPKGNQRAFRELARNLIPGQDDRNFDYGTLDPDQYSSANVTVVEGESQLTFSLWQEEIQMRMDVDPDEYDLDIYGGHPTPHSLGRAARQLANDLMPDKNSKLPTESLIPRNVGIPENVGPKPTPPAED